jgi:hypothetical protein
LIISLDVLYSLCDKGQIPVSHILSTADTKKPPGIALYCKHFFRGNFHDGASITTKLHPSNSCATDFTGFRGSGSFRHMPIVEEVCIFIGLLCTIACSSTIQMKVNRADIRLHGFPAWEDYCIETKELS